MKAQPQPAYYMVAYGEYKSGDLTVCYQVPCPETRTPDLLRSLRNSAMILAAKYLESDGCDHIMQVERREYVTWEQIEQRIFFPVARRVAHKKQVPVAYRGVNDEEIQVILPNWNDTDRRKARF